MSSRRGSILIYCLALAALLVIVGYGFLRSTRSDVQAHDASNRHQLAQSAARMGVTQALEALVGEYAQSTVRVAQVGGSVELPAITHLDGAYRAPFVSFHRPNELENVDYNHPQADDDASSENQVTLPLLQWAGGDEGTSRHSWHARAGTMVYDGRGRYLEPEFVNVTRPDPGLDPQAVLPVRFTDLAPALPERARPLLLDRGLVRVDSGNVVADRLVARYRLRTVIGVEDLSAHLLSNAVADDDGAWWEPTPAYRHPPAWVQGSQEAWHNMVQAMNGNGITTALRWQHVFMGRGNASNVDRAPGTGAPVTFPRMFRHRHVADRRYWGYYGYGRTREDLPRQETAGLYGHASVGGGDPLTEGSAESRPFVAAHYGPQFSWLNQYFAIQGWLSQWESDIDYYGSQAPGWGENMFATTPYGQRLIHSRTAPTTWRWYEGRVDTPWYVNVMTASPRTVHCMLRAFVPPRSRLVVLDREQFNRWDAGNEKWGNAIDGVRSIPPEVRRVGNRDLFTRLSGPAFAWYAPPTADGIDPNFQAEDARPDSERYPGTLWWADDHFGEQIDVSLGARVGFCTHTGKHLYFPNAGAESHERLSPVTAHTTPPTGWDDPATLHERDRILWDSSGDAFGKAPSYYADIIIAFTQAIAITRATWVQYPTRTFDPSSGFTPVSLRDPALHQSLADVDRLFLRQLGENFATPGDGVPLATIRTPDITGGNNRRVGQVYDATTGITPRTIRVLVDEGIVTPDQANVMERVLNDVRMSFLGASPQYSEDFRPLDFSGDGEVHASAYSQRLDATADALAQGLAWWRAVETDGRGPAPEHWFSLTGCFFVGKSRHFRIFSRGEVWDSLIRKPVAEAQLETVAVIDPEGTEGARDVRILFQRWHYNRYTGHLPRQTD